MALLQKLREYCLDRTELRNKKKLKKYIKKYSKSNWAKTEYVEQLVERETENWKNNKSRENAIKAKAFTAILIGCILLLFSFFVEVYCSTIELIEIHKSVLNAFLNVLNIVISMVVGIGVSTIVLDFFSYVQYTRDRLKEIIVDKPFIKKLSDEEKRNIIYKAEESLYFKDGRILPNSLYADVKKKITPLLNSCYFSEYYLTISCDIDEKNKIIRKEILKTMKIMCNENDSDFVVPFSVSLRRPDCEEVEQAYEIVSCVFQAKDVTDDFIAAQEEIKIKEGERVSRSDDTRFDTNYVFKLKKGENSLELRTKTVVPIEDNAYNHYFTLPCMKYSATFNINTDNYSVSGYGFALEDNRNLEDGKRNVNYSRVGNSLTIRIDEWALPGEGCMFTIDHK